MRFLCLLFAFCLAAPALAQTPEEQARLDWVVQRGRLLFEIDLAAGVTTDDLTAQHVATAGILGWTVERDGDAWLVNYYARAGGGLVSVYRGRVERGRVVSREVFAAAARPPLTPVQLRIAAARDAMDGFTYQRCTPARLNLTVIPPETADAPVELYALAALTEANVYPFGGHYLLTISPAGRIATRRPFTRSCLNMDLRGGDGRPAALNVTHLLDPLPTEIHALLSHWTGLPIYVGIGEPTRVWEVTRDRIRLVERPPAAPTN